MHHTELASRRRSLRLSQAELAERLGVHPNTVAKWERGDQGIRHPRMLRAMLDAIEEELRQEPPEVQQAREERWQKWLVARGDELEANAIPEQRAAAERWFGRH